MLFFPRRDYKKTDNLIQRQSQMNLIVKFSPTIFMRHQTCTSESYTRTDPHRVTLRKYTSF